MSGLKHYTVYYGDQHSVKTVKVLPYLLPSIGPTGDPGIQAVSPQVTIKSFPAVGTITFRQACGHFPSRASPSFDQYQVILLSDRGT